MQGDVTGAGWRCLTCAHAGCGGGVSLRAFCGKWGGVGSVPVLQGGEQEAASGLQRHNGKLPSSVAVSQLGKSKETRPSMGASRCMVDSPHCGPPQAAHSLPGRRPCQRVAPPGAALTGGCSWFFKVLGSPPPEHNESIGCAAGMHEARVACHCIICRRGCWPGLPAWGAWHAPPHTAPPTLPAF